MKDEFYKNNPSDRVMWIKNFDTTGEFVFSFDGEKTYNLFADYPHKLTAKEKAIFDRENPQWAEYFRDRESSE